MNARELTAARTPTWPRIATLCLVGLLPVRAPALERPARDFEGATVYVAADEGDLVREAARDLTHYLQAATGVRLQTMSRPPAAGRGNSLAFLLGKAALADGLQVPATRFGRDGFAIDLRDGVIRLAGETDESTYFAVSHFLELQGIRWYTPGPHGEIVPNRDTLVLPDAPIRQTPSFWSRRPWYHGGREAVSDADREAFRLWALRNKAIGGIDVGQGHMWSQVFRPLGGLSQMAEDHPEWFYSDGDSSPPTRHDLCILHPGVVELFVDYYRRRLEGEPRDVHQILSICPDDGFYDFTCAGCRDLISRADPIFTHMPDVSDVIVSFANRVLEGLNAHYPNVQLTTYVYSNFQAGPRLVAPHPNLVGMFAPLGFDRYHHTGDPRSPSRFMLGQIVERWAAQTDAPFGWYAYSYLCPDAFMPFTRLHMVGPDLPRLFEQGARYWSIETAKNWPNHTPDYYLAARLTWDVGLDQRQLLDEFYDLYFGAAGSSMKAYQEELILAYSSLPFSAGNKEFMGAVFTAKRLALLRRLMDGATEAVAGDEARRHRVRMFDLVLQQAERFMAMRSAVNLGDFAAAQRLNGEIRAGYEEQMAFDPLMTNPFLKRAWYEAFYGRHVEELAEWTSQGRIVHIFPDSWPAYLDIGDTGEEEGAHRADAVHFGSFELKTFSACLGEQGWERYRGAIWYQQRFRLPPAAATRTGSDLHLLLAGVDDSATVWLDGSEIGGYETGTFGPHLIALPTMAQDSDHVLTIRVTNEAVTELGTGGIIRPVCLLSR